MQNSALYRYPTAIFLSVTLSAIPSLKFWAKKLTSSMVIDQQHCTFLCVGERKCYSFNIAAHPDSKGLYLCELLATDKYRETKMFQANDTFHHYDAWVRSLIISMWILYSFISMRDGFDKKFVLSSQSPCECAPCGNGGICVLEYERNSFQCDWAPGFCGILCERRGIEISLSTHSVDVILSLLFKVFFVLPCISLRFIHFF